MFSQPIEPSETIGYWQDRATKAEVENDRLHRLVDTLSRGLARYQDEEIGPEFCRCGRPTFYGVGSTDPRCPGCEYMAAETCDCVPV